MWQRLWPYEQDRLSEHGIADIGRRSEGDPDTSRTYAFFSPNPKDFVVKKKLHSYRKTRVWFSIGAQL